MRKTLTLAVAVLAVALCATAATATTATPSELLGLAPADARVVIGIDVAALRSHPAVQDWLFAHQSEWSGVDDDGARFLRDAGLDPTRDVDAMLFAVESPDDESRFVAFFAGRYDPSALSAALLARGATATTIGTFEVYRFDTGSHTGVHPPTYLHISPSLLTMGPEAELLAALQGSGDGSKLVREEIAAGRLDPRSSFWMATRIPDAVHDADVHIEGDMAGVVSAAKTLQRVTMQADLGTALRLRACALADTADNADLLRDAVKGAVAAARLAAQEKHPELVEVLRDVDVDTAGNAVAVAAAVPLDVLQRLLDHGEGAGVTVSR